MKILIAKDDATSRLLLQTLSNSGAVGRSHDPTASRPMTSCWPKTPRVWRFSIG